MLKTSQIQKQTQKLVPVIVQKQNLLMLPNLALEQRIKQEIELNPFLEEVDEIEEVEHSEEPRKEEIDALDTDTSEVENTEPDKEEEFDIEDFIDDDYEGYKTQTDDAVNKRLAIENLYKTEATLKDNLLIQLYLQSLTDREFFIGEELIEFIDSEGYIREEIPELTESLNKLREENPLISSEITEEEVKKVLDIIKTFDPPGIASKNLQECLITQVKRSDENDEFKKLCIKVLTDYLDDLRLKRYEKLIRELNLDTDTVNKIFDFIAKLDPKPGLTSESIPNVVIYPDFIVYEDDGQFKVELTDWHLPSIRINSDYLKYIKKGAKVKSETKKYVKENYERAKWFIDAINSRRETMLKVMNAILKRQYKFFETSGEQLAPLFEKDIAEDIGMDISTVSRTVKGKYVQTDFGIFELKHFFSNALKSEDGNDVSTREIKNKIKELIDNENKNAPYTDEELVIALEKLGYKLSRRTVAKYRDAMKIPKARLRRKI
ncbi:MAG: RNA polymerase factor sigma-54 [Ignavibacteria bacterium]|nr:RNA polymerase factor sigma-54 [Ignavibacteria bacterium]